MGSKNIQQMYVKTCIDRSVIVAFSAEPPGVNEFCVYGYHLQKMPFAEDIHNRGLANTHVAVVTNQ